ncbi:S-adenosyl-L-methionine-dependent methyltransferase [Phlebopus sp. FC_14]|nr:S-adenosyl-L-methionine-dependent methyltransferase [Phlebopus sp. FC_14]
MATFGETNFNTAIYAASRPTYPRELYEFVFSFHRRSQSAQWERAIDLGCGTGQATTELTPFRHVTGVDPSTNMIQSARESPAETLSFLEDGSVDLVIAAQAAHWFDWSRMWPELARILRKGGSAAFWIYSEFRMPAYPGLTSVIKDYSEGTDVDNSVGPYWQQPGRSILANHLVAIPEGNAIVDGAFGTLDREYFTGQYYPDLPFSRPIILRKTMSWDDILGYLRTWSALHTFKDKNADDAQNPNGPIEVRFWNTLKEGVVQKDGGLSDQVDLEWPVAMVLARKV